MKVAIVLVALFAVSQAAFTSRLSQQAKPILNDAVAKMRLVSRSSINFRESSVVDNLVDTLQQQAENIMEQIQSALTSGQAVANNVIEQYQQTMAALQAAGASATTQASSILSSFLSGLGGIFGNLFGRAGKGAIADHISAQISALIEQYNVEHHVTNVLSSTWVQGIAGLIEHLGWSQSVQNAITSILPAGLSQYVLGHFNPSAKGMFDGLTNTFQNIAGQVSAASQSLISTLTNTLSQLTTVASGTWEQMQALAAQFASAGISQVQSTLGEATTDFLAFLKPYQQDLGALYQQVVGQVTDLVGNFA